MRYRKTKAAAVLAAIIIALALASEMDYRDHVREHEHYCRMVAHGHWPDFRGSANCHTPGQPTSRERRYTRK